MANTLKLGEGTWGTKEGSLLAYNDENGNYKPLPFDFTRASSATVVNRSGLIETVQSGIPRIDFLGNTNGALLLEPQSTNLITESENFSDASWGKTAAIVVSNSTISPDGTQNASKIQSTQTGTSYVAPNNLTLTIGNTYTFSCFAKKGNNDWIRLAHVTSGGTGCWFDLENGVVGTVNSQSATIEDYGNGWYRCTNTFIATATTNLDNAFIGICDADGSTNAGVIGKNDYIYGAQLEQSSYPTSYIPTQGSTVTRVAETCSGAGDVNTFNDSEGVLFVEISGFENNALSRVISISDGTTSNRINLFFSSNQSQVVGRVSSGGVTVADMIYSGITQTSYNKIAVKWKVNDFALWLNGVEVLTDSSGVVPIGLNVISFNNASTAVFLGKTKDVRVYNTALTDAELRSLTRL